MLSEFIFRLVGIEDREKANARDPKYLIVTYGVKRKDGVSPEWFLPVPVTPERIDDVDLVRVARSYLAKSFEALAAETTGWKLSQAWFDENAKDRTR